MFGFPFTCYPVPLLAWATMYRCMTAPWYAAMASANCLARSCSAAGDTIVTFPTGRIAQHDRQPLPATHAAAIIDISTARRRPH